MEKEKKMKADWFQKQELTYWCHVAVESFNRNRDTLCKQTITKWQLLKVRHFMIFWKIFARY